jgi:hypothetical protein
LNQNTTGNAATVTTNANLSGDVTSVGNAATVVKINGTSLAGLSTGILKNTTTTGVPTIAVAGTDYQVPVILTTTGTGAATLTGNTLNIPTPTSSSGTAHYVGEVYGGGIVFYITPGGFHGLIAANTNIGNTAPFDFINRSTDPVWHNANNTANGGNLYLDWRAPTYSQLLLLYAARNTSGLNLGSGILISSSNDDNDSFAFKCINFSTGALTLLNGNWVPYTGRAIRSF